MRSIAALVAVAAVAALAFPAGAAPPPGKRIAALQAKIKRLEAENRVLAQVNALGLRRERALARRIASVDSCPITRPNGSSPPGPVFGSQPHGNGEIWVNLWYANVVVWQENPDGSIRAKHGWWRGVPGELRIEGRRLDGPAPPLRVSVPEGYGDSGFQATALIFPTAGCWEVTGRVGDASLTFVTLALGA